MSTSTSVRHINTRSFQATITAYRNHIRTFEQIATQVDNILGNLLDNWQGRGRDSFRMAMTQICQCMEDIHGSMGVLEQTLTAAADAYVQTDSSAASAFKG